MKKVLIYKHSLLSYSETFIKEQILAYSRWQAVLVGLHRIAGLTLEGLDVRILRNAKPMVWDRIYWRILRELKVTDWGVVARLKQEKADLLHVHFGTDAVEVWPVAKALNLPLVVTLHGYDINIFREWWESGQGGREHTSYPRLLLQIAQRPNVYFLAVSEAVRQRAIHFGIPSEKLTVSYIGIDINKFTSNGKLLSKRLRRVLYVGRMVDKKGGQFLIEAFARIYNEIPEAELVMIGDGPLLQSFKALAIKLNVPVQFLGALTSTEVKANMDEARVFCLPSITAANGDAEGLPIVILEAQAAGLPVITSARGGTTEGIIHGTTGFAFPERDVDALANHLRTLLLDDELALTMSEATSKFIAKKFDVRVCAANLETFYDERIES